MQRRVTTTRKEGSKNMNTAKFYVDESIRIDREEESREQGRKWFRRLLFPTQK